jgi:hypothetical protein
MTGTKPKRQTDEKSVAVRVTKKAKTEDFSLKQRFQGRILINFWRKYSVDNTTEKVIEAYKNKGLLLGTIKGTSFEDTVTLLKEQNTIAVAKRCLMRFDKLSGYLHGTDHVPNLRQRVNVRVFLSSLIMIAWQSQVFETMGDLEVKVLDAAKKMITNFEAMIHAITVDKKTFRNIPTELTRSFNTLLFNYFDRFERWKVIDEKKLVARIKHALVALLEARKHLSGEEGKSMEDIVFQLKRLKNKLLQIGGPDIVREFEREQPELESVDGSTPVEMNGESVLKRKKFQNEQLAHELLLNASFQMTEDTISGCYNLHDKKVRDAFHQAFWTSLESDLRLAQPTYKRVLRILHEVRDGVAELAGGVHAVQIRELVDSELLVQKIQEKALDWTDVRQLLTGIFEIIKKVQCSRRDIETLTMWMEKKEALDTASIEIETQPTAFCKTLEFLLGRVNAMRLDAANARLRIIAPVVRDHGVEYERGKMQEKIQSGEVTLNVTRGWLEGSMVRLIQQGESSVVEDVANGNGLGLVVAYGSAIVDLIENKELAIPETLSFEVRRLNDMRDQYERLVVYSIVLLTVKQTVPNRAFMAERDMVKGLVAAEEEAVEDWKDNCISIAASIVGTDRLHAFMSIVEKRLANPTEAVHALMRKRVRAFWEKAVNGPRSTIEELRGVEGLKTMARKWTSTLAHIVSVNVRVHGPIYDTMMPLAAIEARMSAA